MMKIARFLALSSALTLAASLHAALPVIVASDNADNPQYAEKYSALGIRIALDYIVYSMTH